MSNIRENYRKTNDKVKEEWFKYKEQYSGAGNLSITSFVAGWNSRDAEVQRLEDKLKETQGELLTYYNDWVAAVDAHRKSMVRVRELENNSIFESKKLRELSTFFGVACPESDEDLFNQSGLILGHILRVAKRVIGGE